jgi:tellurite resistance-related uncharacterized protein
VPKLIDMKQLPKTALAYKRTATFTQDSIPPGLLKAHQTKAGTWGKIVVLSGDLVYRILEPSIEEVHLASNDVGIVEPGVRHEVQALGPVSFYVEFCRQTPAE